MTFPPSIAPANRRVRLVLGLLALLGSCRGVEGDVLVIADGAAAEENAAACPPVAQAMLLLDRDGRFASYDPRGDLLRERGSVAAHVDPGDCPSAEVALALDRQGAAWIVSCDGDLLKCDPDSGVCVGGQASAPLPASVHMTFAAEPGGGQALFLAVSPARIPASGPPAQSSLRRFPDLDRPLAALTGWPALAGTMDRLWALYPRQPGRAINPPRLVSLDPASGREVESRELAGVVLEPTPVLLAAPGGDLWVLQAGAAETRAQRISATGQGIDTPRSIPRIVVGAASSTCSR